MNIRDHIEAGHYPTDEKGRALVPTSRPNAHAVIAATDCPVGDWLLGWEVTTSAPVEGVSDGGKPYCWRISWWRSDGEVTRSDIDRVGRLLPPPPRKVKVTAYGLVGRKGLITATVLRSSVESVAGARSTHIVELTGEYDEPWDTKA
ncbi:hypothetical protein [Reyranella sp.]|uniref:hypothetical protein n=1 Tax=Reyranella sp. TaxID=1929291 RepID=UPI001216E5A8|nr:hypothetical protein [Reyranella sp.]TAJ89693.1 MAG: hypothetical protein EPO50_04840 [Reyranella sp.]